METAIPATTAETPSTNGKATPKAPAKKKATRKAKADVTLGDLAQRYIKHLEGAGKSPGTCSSYTAELRLAIKEMGGDTKISGITPDQVAAFFESKVVTRLKSGRAKAKPSIDKTRRVLRLALVWAAEKKWIKSAPIPESKD